jgi:ABC-type protease/lipase transport system fused ATPase/permease subunit
MCLRACVRACVRACGCAATLQALDEMLKRHRGVAIVIAHRLTTIKNCDKIIVMVRYATLRAAALH